MSRGRRWGKTRDSHHFPTLRNFRAIDPIKTDMPRRSRTVIPRIPHHVTQRGARRQDVFFTDRDRFVYLDLLSHNAARYGADLLAYTLMTNHVHHLVVPHEKDSLQWVFQVTHKRYAEYLNTRHNWTGHLWQSRFYSSAVDDSYFWTAVKYIYRNPVEAGMAAHAMDYPWSSARAHCNGTKDPYLTQEASLAPRLSMKVDWVDWLRSPVEAERIAQLRKCTRRDLPTGSPEFLDSLEEKYGVVAHAPKMGRPRKSGKVVAVTSSVPLLRKPALR
ncbi:MAG: hypothetical protein RL326_1873 [Pseudomonadota bacterium]|jgi:putative transposase